MLKYCDLLHFGSVQGIAASVLPRLQGDFEEEDTKLKGKDVIGEGICCDQFHVSHLTLESKSI